MNNNKNTMIDGILNAPGNFFLTPFVIFLILFLIAFGFFVNTVVFLKNANSVMVTVTKLDQERKEVRVRRSNGQGYRTETETTFSIWVSYTVDGVEYEKHFNRWVGANEGESVKMFYNPKNPSDLREGDDYITVTACLLISGFLTAVCGIFVAMKVKYDKDERAVMESGTIILCNVVRVAYNKNVKINNRYPQYLVCSGVNPDTGELTEFSTNSSMEDLQRFVGRQIPAYVANGNFVVNMKKVLKDKF